MTKKLGGSIMSEAKTRHGRNWKEELAHLVEFLNVGDDQAKTLWDVLAALRGPDITQGDPHRLRKKSTTEVIRNSIGLNSALYTGLPVDVSPDTPEKLAFRHDLFAHAVGHLDHFTMHAMWAFDALNLRWDALNENQYKEAWRQR